MHGGQFLHSVKFIRRYELAQKGNHSEAWPEKFLPAEYFLRSVQVNCKSEITSKRGIKNSEFETMNVFSSKNNSGTQLNIQMTQPDQDITQIIR